MAYDSHLSSVIRLVVEETLFTESKFIFLFVNVSVTVDIFDRRDSWSCAKPPTWRARDFYCQCIFPLDKLLTKTYKSYLPGLILEYFPFPR
jgi:hypothetical protein